jgi:hypothetical protein
MRSVSFGAEDPTSIPRISMWAARIGLPKRLATESDKPCSAVFEMHSMKLN